MVYLLKQIDCGAFFKVWLETSSFWGSVFIPIDGFQKFVTKFEKGDKRLPKIDIACLPMISKTFGYPINEVITVAMD